MNSADMFEISVKTVWYNLDKYQTYLNTAINEA